VYLSNRTANANTSGALFVYIVHCEIASSSSEGWGRARDASSSCEVWGAESREYADFVRLEEEESEVSALRLDALESAGDLRYTLQAASRDLAAFSSEMAVVRAGTVEAAMSDILESCL
jgi:hypothetical protein